MLPELFLAVQFHFAFDLNIVSDAPLHPMVKEALADQGPLPAYEDNAHVYLLGMVAGEGEDSFEVGKRRFMAAEKIIRYQDRDSYERYPKAEIPALSQEDGFCNLPDDREGKIRCFQKLEISCSENISWVTNYQFTLENYEKILASDALRSPSIIVDLHWNTLDLFRAVGVLDNRDFLKRSLCNETNDKDMIINELVFKGEALRHIYAQADEMLLKVVLFIQLKDFYQWNVYSYRRGVKEIKALPAEFFSLQTKQESSFRPAMFREIRNLVSTNREAWESALREAQNKNWFGIFSYKENLTINDTSRPLRDLILDSEIPIEHYITDHMPKAPRPFFKWWRIGNYTGEIISMVSIQRWINISSDINNLDLIIRLSDIAINHSELVDNNQLSSLPLSKRNPYDNSLPYFDESGKWLCFKVPEELKTQDECIYLN